MPSVGQPVEKKSLSLSRVYLLSKLTGPVNAARSEVEQGIQR